MRVIYKIARLELSNLFYSPVAWLLLVFFVFGTGMMFSSMLENVARQQDMGGQLYSLSFEIFSGSYHLWDIVKMLLYVLMPLLTMGVVSQEFNQGSIKMLFSSPITCQQIVFGKFLGIMIYGLFLIGILVLYAIIGGCIIDSFEWPAVFTGLLGLYFLFGLYAAIGLFMSTLTTYQIVSAIGMFAMLIFLSMVSGMWQEYSFVRDITFWLAIGNRVESFIAGMICSEDLLYFIIVSGMFLGFAILKLQLRRENCTFLNKAMRYSVVFIVAMLLGYTTSRPGLKLYYDATFTKANTLTKASQDIMAKLDGGLKITTYVNLLGSGHTITPKDVKRDISRYNQYIRFKPEIKLDYVFYYHSDTTNENFKKRFPHQTLKEVAEEQVKYVDTKLNKYLTPNEIGAKIDLSNEKYRFVCLIERESGEKTFLRIYDDQTRVPLETEISAALKRVVMKLPKVGFLSDHGARSITGDRNRDYSYMVAEKTYRSAMINQGFDVVDIQLSRSEQELDDLDILVVSEPLAPFTENEFEALTRYIDNGKNLIIAGKPKTNSFLKPLMDLLGIQFMPGTLVQKPLDEYTVSLLFTKAPDEAQNFSDKFREIHDLGKKGYVVVMPGAAGIEIKEDKGFKTTPLLVSQDDLCWNEVETVDFLNEKIFLNPTVGEVAGPKLTMLALERECNGMDQRIIVSGDADCISMGELSASRRGVSPINGMLIMSAFHWLSYGELPINTVRPRNIDNHISLTSDGASNLRFVIQWVFPVLILLMGLLVLVRRKRK